MKLTTKEMMTTMIMIAIRKCRMCGADFDVHLRDKKHRNDLYCEACMPIANFKRDMKQEDCEAPPVAKEKKSNDAPPIQIQSQVIRDDNPYAKLPSGNRQKHSEHKPSKIEFSQVSEEALKEIDKIDLTEFGM